VWCASRREHEERAVIHLDNAATASWRPDAVGRAFLNALSDAPANPGRSGHALGLTAARLVEQTRGALAELLGIPDPMHLTFTKHATEAINIVLAGYLRQGDVALVSSWEHNAVMRPLRWLERERSVCVEVIPGSLARPVDLDWLRARLSRGEVRLVVVTSASNVTGQIMPFADVGALCRDAGVMLLVDGAQGAGVLDIDVEAARIDALAVTGHKGLLGPPGTGALYLRQPESVEPLIRGGTGSRSEEQEQPAFSPDRFEAGTANVPGIAALGAGVRYVMERTAGSIREHVARLSHDCAESLRDLSGITLLRTSARESFVGIVSFTVADIENGDVARELEVRDVLCRHGLHCAPLAHQTLGTIPAGTVRLSLSPSTTRDQISAAVLAVKETVTKARSDT
jgi:cysteine desulfurase/selenocysteine lyase